MAPPLVAVARAAGRHGLPHEAWLRGVRRALVALLVAAVLATALVVAVTATVVTIPRWLVLAVGATLVVIDALVRAYRAARPPRDDKADPEATRRARQTLYSVWTWLLLLATLLAAQTVIVLLSPA